MYINQTLQLDCEVETATSPFINREIGGREMAENRMILGFVGRLALWRPTISPNEDLNR